MSADRSAWRARLRAIGGPKADAFREKARLKKARQRAAKRAREGKPPTQPYDWVEAERIAGNVYERRECRVLG